MIDNSAVFTKPIIGMQETNTMLITYAFLYIPWFKNSITLNLELVKVQSMVADWKCKRNILILFTLRCRYFSSKVTGQWFTLTDILHTEKRGFEQVFPITLCTCDLFAIFTSSYISIIFLRRWNSIGCCLRNPNQKEVTFSSPPFQFLK